MPEIPLHNLEEEMAELVKRSRQLSVEMTKVSERMLLLGAEITKRKAALKHAGAAQPATVGAGK